MTGTEIKYPETLFFSLIFATIFTVAAIQLGDPIYFWAAYISGIMVLLVSLRNLLDWFIYEFQRLQTIRYYRRQAERRREWMVNEPLREHGIDPRG